MPITSTNSLRLRDARSTKFILSRTASGQQKISFTSSSEHAVDRGGVSEVLSHAASAPRLGRANGGSVPILFNHDWDDPIGMVGSAALAAKKLNIDGTLFNTARGQEIGAMIDGGLKNVSLGYQVHAGSMNKAGDTFTATDWEPYEVSIVSVPADPTVGVGRKLPTQRATVTQARRSPAPMVIALGSKPAYGTPAHCALHEAAHVAALSRGKIAFKQVRIFDFDSGSVDDLDIPHDARGLEAMIVAALAGGVAANVHDAYFPGASLVTSGAAADFRKAEAWINELCRDHDFERREPLIKHGLSPGAIFEERAHRFVNANQRQIYLIANELLARKKLTAAEVAELL